MPGSSRLAGLESSRRARVVSPQSNQVLLYDFRLLVAVNLNIIIYTLVYLCTISNEMQCLPKIVIFQTQFTLQYILYNHKSQPINLHIISLNLIRLGWSRIPLLQSLWCGQCNVPKPGRKTEEGLSSSSLQGTYMFIHSHVTWNKV